MRLAADRARRPALGADLGPPPSLSLPPRPDAPLRPDDPPSPPPHDDGVDASRLPRIRWWLVVPAAALAVLDVFNEEHLVERAGVIGNTIRSRMEAWQERWAAIGDVRGLGAMLAIELVLDRETKEPDADRASAVVEEAAQNGLLLIKSGVYGNCIRVLTPLVVTDAELEEALGVWEQALDKVLTV